MLTYLEKCFDEKLVEIIYLSINLLLFVQTKLWQGIFMFKVIFSLYIEHSKKKFICLQKKMTRFGG